MRYLLIVSTFIALIVCPATFAQDEYPYRLDIPDVNGYLRGIADIADLLDDRLKITILLEMHSDYGEQLSTAGYSPLIDTFNILYPPSGDYSALPYQNEWEHARLLAWLRENNIDLSLYNHLSFDDYDIRINGVDFNSDGKDEHIVDVVRGCATTSDCRPDIFRGEGSDYHEYLVLQQEESANYSILLTPLPWLSDHYHYRMAQSGSILTSQIDDINQDNLPEWLVLSLSPVGQDNSEMRLYILGERAGKLVDLAVIPVSYIDYSSETSLERLNIWSVNKEKSGSPALIQRLNIYDNWLCQREEVTSFGWDGQAYHLQKTDIQFPDTFACLTRQAEALMYSGDPSLAVPYYEQAIALDDENEYHAYIVFRLAIAYAVTGNLESAINQLRSLSTDENVSRLANTVLNAYSEMPSVESICLSAYNFFVREPYYISSQFHILPGRIAENTRLFQSQYIEDPPATAGCDVDILLNQILANHTFTITSSPTEQMTKMGWNIRKTFQADLNGDQLDEWLVWLDSDMLYPVLFISSGDHYEATRFIEPAGYPYPPDGRYKFSDIELPGQQGNALVTLDRVIVHPYLERINRQMGGGPQCDQSPQPPGELKMWRLVDASLTPFFFTFICGEGNIPDFVNDTTVTGWVSDSGGTLVQQTYTWNSETENYASAPLPTFTASSEEKLENPPSVDLDGLLFQVIRDHDAGNLSDSLEAIENILTHNHELSSDDFQFLHYLRALTLEALNRSDEALAEYVMVYETAPKSAWGKLAALHLVRVEND